MKEQAFRLEDVLHIMTNGLVPAESPQSVHAIIAFFQTGNEQLCRSLINTQCIQLYPEQMYTRLSRDLDGTKDKSKQKLIILDFVETLRGAHGDTITLRTPE